MLKQANWQYESLWRSPDEYPTGPDYWRKDVEGSLAAIDTAISSRRFPMLECDQQINCKEGTIESWQRLIGQYGSVLEHWPDIVAASQELRQRGQELARNVN